MAAASSVVGCWRGGAGAVGWVAADRATPPSATLLAVAAAGQQERIKNGALCMRRFIQKHPCESVRVRETQPAEAQARSASRRL